MGLGFAPLAVSSTAHTDSHKKICKQMLKELSQASSCCSFLENLDAFFDKKDKLEESVCNGGIFHYSSLTTFVQNILIH